MSCFCLLLRYRNLLAHADHCVLFPFFLPHSPPRSRTSPRFQDETRAQRAERLERARQEKELKGCTFAPKTGQSANPDLPRTSVSSDLSRSISHLRRPTTSERFRIEEQKRERRDKRKARANATHAPTPSRRSASAPRARPKSAKAKSKGTAKVARSTRAKTKGSPPRSARQTPKAKTKTMHEFEAWQQQMANKIAEASMFGGSAPPEDPALEKTSPEKSTPRTADKGNGKSTGSKGALASFGDFQADIEQKMADL